MATERWRDCPLSL